MADSQTDSRPPQHMPMPHWDWTTGAGPPGSRISVLAPADDPTHGPAVVLPGPGARISFADHIKPLFHERDRSSMRFAVDLSSHADVS